MSEEERLDRLRERKVYGVFRPTKKAGCWTLGVERWNGRDWRPGEGKYNVCVHNWGDAVRLANEFTLEFLAARKQRAARRLKESREIGDMRRELGRFR